MISDDHWELSTSLNWQWLEADFIFICSQLIKLILTPEEFFENAASSFSPILSLSPADLFWNDFECALTVG